MKGPLEDGHDFRPGISTDTPRLNYPVKTHSGFRFDLLHHIIQLHLRAKFSPVYHLPYIVQ